MEYIIYESDTNLYLSSDLAESQFALQKKLADDGDAGIMGTELTLVSSYYKINIQNKTKTEIKSILSANDGDTLVYKDSSEVGL
jgi:hypothetical protein